MVYPLLRSFLQASLCGLVVAVFSPPSSRDTAFGGSVLSYGTPDSVSLLPEPLKELETNITGYLTPANYGSASFDLENPLYPGATVMYRQYTSRLPRYWQYFDLELGTRIPSSHILLLESLWNMQTSMARYFLQISSCQWRKRRFMIVSESS